MIFNLNTVNFEERNLCECSLSAVLINDSLPKLVQYTMIFVHLLFNQHSRIHEIQIFVLLSELKKIQVMMMHPNKNQKRLNKKQKLSVRLNKNQKR